MTSETVFLVVRVCSIFLSIILFVSACSVSSDAKKMSDGGADLDTDISQDWIRAMWLFISSYVFLFFALLAFAIPYFVKS